jgi:hypothetical protein
VLAIGSPSFGRLPEGLILALSAVIIHPDGPRQVQAASAAYPEINNATRPLRAAAAAVLGDQDARQAVQQRGLARTARPHDRDDHAQRGASQRRRFPERFHQVLRLDDQ